MLLTITRKYIVILIISELNYFVHSEVFEVKISLVNWYISFITKAKPISETIVIIKQFLYFALFEHIEIFNFWNRNVISVYS